MTKILKFAVMVLCAQQLCASQPTATSNSTKPVLAYAFYIDPNAEQPWDGSVTTIAEFIPQCNALKLEVLAQLLDLQDKIDNIEKRLKLLDEEAYGRYDSNVFRKSYGKHASRGK